MPKSSPIAHRSGPIALAIAAALALVVSGCAGQTPAAPPTDAATASAPASAPAASETSTDTQQATPAAWATTALTDVSDCASLATIVEPPASTDPDYPDSPTLEPMWSEEYPNGPAQSELRDAGVTPPEGCRWQLNLYEWIAVHVGTLPSEPSGDLFTTFEGSAEGQSYPEAYSSETVGDGTVYSVTSFCNERFVCDVLHFVEGDVLVTLVRPTGADAGGQLDAIVAELRR